MTLYPHPSEIGNSMLWGAEVDWEYLCRRDGEQAKREEEGE
jgi:hypothetical protein